MLTWQVFGGTVNSGDGALTVRTTAAAADTAVARLARLVEEVLPLPKLPPLYRRPYLQSTYILRMAVAA